MRHGQILGGVVTTPDIAGSLADYRDVLGWRVVDDTPVSDQLARAWAAPATAGAPMVALRPPSGADCTIRLVEQPAMPAYRPTTSFGWAAFEMTVRDVFDWPRRLDGSGFTVVGPPKAIPGMDAFVPMQVVGRGGEVLYLNEVFGDMAASDLPRAACDCDRIFILVLAARDRPATLRWYRDRLALDEGATHVIAYTMINRAFGLPADTRTALTMLQSARDPVIEVDDYPPAATPRPALAGWLPPGNAAVSIAVAGRQGTDWLIGPSGERVELVGIGAADA